MKILLLGKNGHVGWERQRSLSLLGELIALDRHGPASAFGMSLPNWWQGVDRMLAEIL